MGVKEKKVIEENLELTERPKKEKIKRREKRNF